MRAFYSGREGKKHMKSSIVSNSLIATASVVRIPTSDEVMQKDYIAEAINSLAAIRAL